MGRRRGRGPGEPLGWAAEACQAAGTGLRAGLLTTCRTWQAVLGGTAGPQNLLLGQDSAVMEWGRFEPQTPSMDGALAGPRPL